MSARRRGLRVVAVALLAPVLAGCTGQPDERPARSSSWQADAEATFGTTAPGSDAPGTDAADPTGNLRLLAEHGPAPLDAYGWSAEEADTVARAVEELTARCMAERGFTFERAPELPAAEPVTHWGGFLGLVSAERAGSTGYQVLDAEARLAERERLEREAAEAPDPAYLAALAGAGAGDEGCSGWAFAQVTPADPAVDPRVQERLYGEALSRAESAAPVERALAGWVGCMGRSGYAIDTVPVPADTAPLTPDVLAQAVADVRCKDETGLVDTYVTELYAAERALADQHRAELDAFAAWGRERVRLATAVLGG